MPTIPANLGEFIASKKTRAGKHSAVPTQFGTVYIPPDGSEYAYLVVKVRLPLAAQDCRFGADEQVCVEFVERDDEWRYTPEGAKSACGDGQCHTCTVDEAYAKLEASLRNSDVGDVSNLEVLAAAEEYAEAREKAAIARIQQEGK